MGYEPIKILTCRRELALSNQYLEAIIQSLILNILNEKV